ncbi:MAG: M23 family metallopeptidase [Candidatus Latescibacterota bacterium]|nr:M23 family metallopeptidase [Candidatus Latescibacterota bacterium]
MSSTFGETRATTLHVGIDVKTWGKTGYPVYAAADGWVERIRTSPWGFGRALYLRLEDGNVAVYAHLESFFEPVAQRVTHEQELLRRYSVQLWPEKGEIPVKRGQLIAYSGETGVGPPHLHFELRDPDQVPLNPLLHGFSIADTIAPSILAVAFFPIGPESTIDGGHDPVALRLRWDVDAGEYHTDAATRVFGRIGVAVRSYDRANHAPNKLAVLRHRLKVDGELWAESSYERVPFSDVHQVSLDRLRLDDGVYSALYRSPGNRLTFYRFQEGDGFLRAGTDDKGLPRGRHELVVEAEDRYGNRSCARLAVNADAPPGILGARLIDDPAGGGSLVEVDLHDADDDSLTIVVSSSATNGDWKRQLTTRVSSAAGPFTLGIATVNEWWQIGAQDGLGVANTLLRAGNGGHRRSGEVPVVISHPTFAVVRFLDLVGRRHPKAIANGEQIPTRLVGVRGDTGVYETTIILEPETTPVSVALHMTAAADTVELSRVAWEPGRSQTVTLASGAVQIHLQERSAYEPAYVQLTPIATPASPGLVMAGVGFEIGPSRISFDRHARLFFALPDTLSHRQRAGLYVDDGEGKWVFLGAERDSLRSMVGAKVRALGRFAMMLDVVPPDVVDLRVRPESGGRRRPVVTATVVDSGSGLGDEDDLIMEIDGVRVPSVYDPEANHISWTPRSDLTTGGHRVSLRICDMAGNETEESTVFTVP